MSLAQRHPELSSAPQQWFSMIADRKPLPLFDPAGKRGQIERHILKQPKDREFTIPEISTECKTYESEIALVLRTLAKDGRLYTRTVKKIKYYKLASRE